MQEAKKRACRRAGRPSREASDDLNQRILDAAYQSFVEHNFSGTTMAGVAALCGTTRRSVMHRYPNREALLTAVASRILRRDLLGACFAPVSSDDFLEGLRQICRRLLAFATTRDTYSIMRVSIGEVGRVPELSASMIEINDELCHRLENMILKAQNAGHFALNGVSSISTLIIGTMISNPLNRAMIGDENFQSERPVNMYFSEVWAILHRMA